MKKYFFPFFLLCSLYNYSAFAREFTLESSAFKQNTLIPKEYTCNGADQSPPLNWHNLPSNTKSLTLVVEDPDAPEGIWTHWLVFNIPPTIKELRAGSSTPQGAANAKNSWGGLGYRGPCPPMGAHSYHFKLYALDKALDLGEGTTPDLVLNTMTGHVVGQTELIGLYQNIKSEAPAS